MTNKKPKPEVLKEEEITDNAKLTIEMWKYFPKVYDIRELSWDRLAEAIKKAEKQGYEQGKLEERERIFDKLKNFLSFGRCFRSDKRFWRYNEETIKWMAVMRGIANKKTRGD